MPQIGPHFITIFNDILSEAMQRIDLLPRQPGVDGTVAAASGWSTEEMDLPTITQITGSIAAASNLIDQYRALHGQHVQITDQFGRAFPNSLIVSVQAFPLATVSVNVWYIRASWRILLATRRPQGR